MRDKPPLSLEEMTAEYTPKSLIKWFDDKFQAIIQTKNSQKALRMRKALYKEFIEEIYPLRLLVELEFKFNDGTNCKCLEAKAVFSKLYLIGLYKNVFFQL